MLDPFQGQNPQMVRPILSVPYPASDIPRASLAERLRKSFVRIQLEGVKAKLANSQILTIQNKDAPNTFVDFQIRSQKHAFQIRRRLQPPYPIRFAAIRAEDAE